MNDLVQFITVDEIAVITVNNPPVNALSPGVPEGIAAAIQKISGDDNIKAGVVQAFAIFLGEMIFSA